MVLKEMEQGEMEVVPEAEVEATEVEIKRVEVGGINGGEIRTEIMRKRGRANLDLNPIYIYLSLSRARNHQRALQKYRTGPRR